MRALSVFFLLICYCFGNAQVIYLPSLNKVMLSPDEIETPSYSLSQLFKNESTQYKLELNQILDENSFESFELRDSINQQLDDILAIESDWEYYLSNQPEYVFKNEYSDSLCYQINSKTEIYQPAELMINQVFWVDEGDIEFPIVRLNSHPATSKWVRTRIPGCDHNSIECFVACLKGYPKHYTLPKSDYQEMIIYTVPLNLEHLTSSCYTIVFEEEVQISQVIDQTSGEPIEIVSWEKVECK